jgi:hypothetical protein
VGGLVQSGGFGSFSKTFGTAAAGLLEAEVVTSDVQNRSGAKAGHLAQGLHMSTLFFDSGMDCVSVCVKNGDAG